MYMVDKVRLCKCCDEPAVITYFNKSRAYIQCKNDKRCSCTVTSYTHMYKAINSWNKMQTEENEA